MQWMEPGIETSDLGQVSPFLAYSVGSPADSPCSLQCPGLTWFQLKPSDFGNFLSVSGGFCIYPQLFHVCHLGLDVLPPCCAPGEGLCSLCLWLRNPRGEWEWEWVVFHVGSHPKFTHACYGIMYSTLDYGFVHRCFSKLFETCLILKSPCNPLESQMFWHCCRKYCLGVPPAGIVALREGLRWLLLPLRGEIFLWILTFHSSGALLKTVGKGRIGNTQ